MTRESVKSYLDNLRCPNGCEAAICCREEEEEVYYVDKVDRETVNYSVAVSVPVFWCEHCSMGWTDHRAEDIRAAAIGADQLARHIDAELVASLINK
jgi:hypothetical protein